MNTDISNKNYIKQINKVIDYIYSNLNKQLSVDELSAQADLSPYHFHRIFSSVVGESLAKYVVRRRLERSAALLLSDKDSPIMNIAYECGFNSVNVFCRNFKRHFGMTAESFRNKKELPNSKNSQFKSTNDPITRHYSHYFCQHKTKTIGGITMNCTFEIKNLNAYPQSHLLNCSHIAIVDSMFKIAVVIS